MCSILEEKDINLTIWHALPHLHLQLFAISVKSKVTIRRYAEITWSTVDEELNFKESLQKFCRKDRFFKIK